MSIRSAISNTFQAKTRIDFEQVSAKLADATAALHALEQERQERALDAALADDPSALLDIESRLAAARSRVESLELAAGEAQRRENARQSEAKSAAERARLAAIRQHAGSASRAAQKISDALEQAISAYHDMQKDVGKLEKLLHPRERVQAVGSGNLLAELKRMTGTELARLARQYTGTEPLSFPGAAFSNSAHGLPHGRSIMDVEPLADRVKARFGVAEYIGGLTPAPGGDAEWVAAVKDHEAAAVDKPAELSAEDVALLTAAQEAGAEMSSAILERNWHDAEVKKHDR